MGKHILVTDDEEHTLLALSLILKKTGFKVTTVGTGAEALDKVFELNDGSEPIDLLVIDLEMPGMTGIEVIETIERLDLTLPIIVISGYEARGLLAENVKLGGVWFLEKPFEPEEFAHCVNNAIEQIDNIRPIRKAKTAPSLTNTSVQRREGKMISSGKSSQRRD